MPDVLRQPRGLRWADVDLEGNSVTVSRSLLPDSTAKPPKTEAGRRTIPMLPALRFAGTRPMPDSSGPTSSWSIRGVGGSTQA